MNLRDTIKITLKKVTHSPSVAPAVDRLYAPR